MYLMDQIVKTAHMARKSIFSKNIVLDIFPYMEEKLRGCPRFLFDENAIKTAVELTLGRPKVLFEAMKHLTIPYPVMWIEWPESGRQKLRETFEIDNYESTTRPLPIRLGFLLESDGRAGTAYWAWDNHFVRKDDCPNVCPISPFFNLDKEFEQQSIVEGFLYGNMSAIWRDNPVQHAALKDIWNTATHMPSEWGRHLLNLPSPFEHSQSRRMEHFYADVYGEYIMIWSTLMLLTSSKKIVDYETVNMSRLNKARKQHDQAPKLDHTIVSLHINKEQHVHPTGIPLGFTRKSPRIHLVSSYLARRGTKHWVVQPYWRGEGEIISRYVKVKP
jgi:hypothetical protein